MLFEDSLNCLLTKLYNLSSSWVFEKDFMKIHHSTNWRKRLVLISEIGIAYSKTKDGVLIYMCYFYFS